MKVLIICPYPCSVAPSQRFRFEQYVPFLRERGVEVQISPAMSLEVYRKLSYPNYRWIEYLFTAFTTRLKNIWQADRFDVIVIHREAYPIGPPFFEKALIKRNPRVVYDFDDSLHVMPGSRIKQGIIGKLLAYLENPQRCATIIAKSAHVTPGNRFLANYALQYNPNVTILPTSINTDSYRPIDRPPRKDICIGWSGSYSTMAHLKTIERVLVQLKKKHPFKLLVIGSHHFTIPGCDVDARGWRLEDELANFAAMDIGVMPLPDNDSTRGKCGLKALQYMAMGLPTICSPVGVNSEMIEDGVNGFLANSEEEWRDKLTLLMENPDLRKSLGNAGRKTVLERYSMRLVASLFYCVLESVAGGDLAVGF